MGIDIRGGMIVGAEFNDLVPYIEDIMKQKGVEDFDIFDFNIIGWLEDNNLDHMSPHFDSRPDYWTIGICINNLVLDGLSELKWNNDLMLAQKRLYDIFGEELELKLIGMQDVT
jgi:hypothetical protein